MQTHAFAAILFMLGAPLAGCLADDEPTTITPSGAGDASAPAPAALADAPVAPLLAATDAEIVEIPIEGTIVTDGAVLPDQIACDPANPGGCEFHVVEIVDVTGTLTGTIVDRFHGHYLPDGTVVAWGTQDFTGSVAGCGSGSMSFTYDAAGGEPDPDHPGDILGFDNLTLVPGSTTIGLAGIVDARLLELFHISTVTYAGAGTIEGTVSCRIADVPDLAANREGAQAIPISTTYTTDGLLLLDQMSCNPARPGVCEGYGTALMEMSGDMEGMFVDFTHIHGNEDATFAGAAVRPFTGSVAGCGSGTLAFLLGGDTSAVEPDLANPGYLYFREPAMTFVPGSTTTGLAGIVDAEITGDFHFRLPDFKGFGTWTGTVWCRTADVPEVAADHEGARAVEIDVPYTTPGTLLPDHLACDPMRPGVCELHALLTWDFEGVMTGSVVDRFHLHFNPDGSADASAWRTFTGSIEGCGSGAVTLFLEGHVEPPEPVLDTPGYVRVVEPTMTLVPGSTTTGFAGVLDAQITGDFAVTATTAGYGSWKGTVWCTAPGGDVAARGSGTGEDGTGALTGALRPGALPVRAR